MTQLIQKRSNLGHIQYLDRVLSICLLVGKLPPPPPPKKKKVFLKKNLKLFQIKIFFDDDFKESVKVTNVQK